MFFYGNQKIYDFQESSYLISNDFGWNWTKHLLPTTHEAYNCITENPDGTFYAFLIEDKKLLARKFYNNGQNYTSVMPVLSNFKPTTFSIKLVNGILHLVFKEENHIYYSSSSNNTLAFSPPQLLSGALDTNDYQFYAIGNNLYVFLASNKDIFLISSYNNGLNFLAPEKYYASNNKILRLAKFNDAFTPQQLELIWLEKDYTHYSVLYSSQQTKSPVILHTLDSEIQTLEAKSTKQCTFLTFHAKPQDIFMLRIFKDGTLINSPNKIYGPSFQAQPFLEYFPNGQKIISLLLQDNRPTAVELKNNIPYLEYIYPQNDLSTNNLTMHFSFSAYDSDQDKTRFGIKISKDNDFKNNEIYIVEDLTSEAIFSLPVKEGKYYLKAYVTDGIASNDAQAIKTITIDKTTPKITLTNLENKLITSASTIEIKGYVSEKAQLTIKGEKVALDNNLFFSKIEYLKDGLNIVNLVATDEATNSTIEPIAIILNADIPRITIKTPSAKSYIKSGSTLIVTTQIIDNKNNISEDSAVEVNIDHQLLKDFLYYNLEDNSAFGFVKIPENLSDGRHTLKLKISDEIGNTSESSVDFEIDNTPPILAVKSLTSSSDRIILPFKEDGIGIDISSSFIRIYESSNEVKGKIKLENTFIVFLPEKPINEGAYKLNFIVRDSIGNSSSAESIPIKIDSVKTFADATNSSLKIINIENGPNPFNIEKDRNTFVKYILSSQCQLEFYIFSLDGDLIYKQTIPQASTSGLIPWNGQTCYGSFVSSGVYPYSLIAKDPSGARDLKRGKILVF